MVPRVRTSEQALQAKHHPPLRASYIANELLLFFLLVRLFSFPFLRFFVLPCHHHVYFFLPQVLKALALSRLAKAKAVHRAANDTGDSTRTKLEVACTRHHERHALLPLAFRGFIAHRFGSVVGHQFALAL